MNDKQIKIKNIKNDLPFLRQISTDVDFKTDNIEEYIALLDKASKQFNLYAISPVQIGLPKRIIFFRNVTEDMSNNFDDNYSARQVMINPVILKQEGETIFLEGCGSCHPYWSYVTRPYKILVEYYDEQGNKKQETIKGFKATVFSHEYDHLDGILHMDLGTNIMLMESDEAKEERKNHPYQVISKTGKYERVVDIKDNFDL